TAVAGDTVTVHYDPTKWAFTAPAAAASDVPLGDLSSTNNRTYIDVRFAPTVLGGGLDTHSIDGGEFTLTGTGATPATLPSFDTTQDPLALGGGRYRYFLLGDFGTGGVLVSFADGSFGTLAQGPVAASTNLAS